MKPSLSLLTVSLSLPFLYHLGLHFTAYKVNLITVVKQVRALFFSPSKTARVGVVLWLYDTGKHLTPLFLFLFFFILEDTFCLRAYKDG